MFDTILKFAELISCLIGLIAIFISIRTVHSQNRVALFEKRYEVYSELRRILEVGERTQAVGRNHRLTAEDAWSTILARMNWTPGTLLEVRSQRVTSETVIRQMDFLYNGLPPEPVEMLFATFRVYIDKTHKKQEKGEDMWSVISRRRANRSTQLPDSQSPTPAALEPWIDDFFRACTCPEMKQIEKSMKQGLSLKSFWHLMF